MTEDGRWHSPWSGRRVVFVAESVSPVAGGVPAVVRQLSERISALGATAQLVACHGASSDLPEGVESSLYPPRGLGRVWAWSPALSSGIERLLHGNDGFATLLHIHGVWGAPQYIASRAAASRSLPFVVSAHGMLEPWLWTEQGWRVRVKKELYWRALAYRALSRARVIHAITPLESDHLRALFPRNRIEVIPNAIDVTEADHPVGQSRSRTILFLGRIEPKKGVDLLLHAFKQASLGAEWTLAIAGPAWSDAYLAQLKRVVGSLDLLKKVKFLGPVFGDEKQRLLDTAWIMATPSHSEVVGLVNLEAAARATPSITTHQTGLDDWEGGGGVLINPNVDELAASLRRCCAWTEDERAERGAASRALVLRRYSWQAVLPQWMSLYDELLGQRT